MDSRNASLEEERRRAEETWRSAAAFGELCELSAKFIEGTSPFFPGYAADRVDAETDELVPFLAAFNRAGFLTTGSQPGMDEPDWKQRAFVDGYALEPVAKQIARVSLYAELHIVVAPPGYSVGFHTPVILRDFMPHGWAGFSSFDELEFFEDASGERAFQELRLAWFISIVDLKWGRNDHLWSSIAQAICYSEKPHPDLGLDFDLAI